MKLRRRSHIVSPLTLALSLAALGAPTACGSSGDDDASAPNVRPGAMPGEACTSNFEGGCPANSTLCYAVGTASSCRGGGLCAGTGTDPLTCAFPCKADADCTATGEPDLVCLTSCAEPLFNGFCTTSAARADLLSAEFCTTPKFGRASVAGVSG